MRHALIVCLNDLLKRIRDRTAILAGIVAPLVLTALMGSALGHSEGFRMRLSIADLDHIYGRMLISNGYFGEARLLFQKNVTRWKTWKTPSPETEDRLKEANSDIAECDRHMGG